MSSRVSRRGEFGFLLGALLAPPGRGFGFVSAGHDEDGRFSPGEDDAARSDNPSSNDDRAQMVYGAPSTTIYSYDLYGRLISRRDSSGGATTSCRYQQS